MTGDERGATDELRRRLYAPGATDEDVARYRTAVPEEPQAAPVGAPEPPRRPRVLPAVAGVLATLAVAGAVIAGQAGAPPASVRTGTPPPTAPGQRALPVPAFARAAFVRALEAGEPAGIRGYLYEAPEARPDAIRTAGRLASSEYHGSGPGTIELDPSALADEGGRTTVLLVLDGTGPFEWRASRISRSSVGGVREVVGRDLGTLRAGEVGTATAEYDGRAPTRLYLAVGEQVRWGAVVIFSD